MSKKPMCQKCVDQLKKSRYDEPHCNLSIINSGDFSGGIYGGYSNHRYKCQICENNIWYSSDKNEML